MSRPTKKELRAMWSPQREELKEQCVSCPFREGNDKEWRGICRKLAAHAGMDPDDVDEKQARLNIFMETMDRGDFSCHHTAYDENMERKPLDELRQCPGASRFYKKGVG